MGFSLNAGTKAKMLAREVFIDNWYRGSWSENADGIYTVCRYNEDLALLMWVEALSKWFKCHHADGMMGADEITEFNAEKMDCDLMGKFRQLGFQRSALLRVQGEWK